MLLIAALILQADVTTWAEYQKSHSLDCVGPFESTIAPEELTLAGKTYRLSGSQLSITSPDQDDEVKFGVMSSIKDYSEETQANLKAFLAWFKQEKVEWLVLNGDVAGDEEEFEDILNLVGETGIPALVSIGNFESRGSYFRVVSAASKKFPTIIDQNLVRVIEADDVTILSMPGYYDRKFLHTGSGCLYKPEDVTKLLDVAEKLPAPKLLVSHGPPKGVGPKSIDVISDGKANVGDPAMTRLIKLGNIAFGIFGHILESSGRGVGADLATPVAQDAWSQKLYINAGNANALPWELLDGTTMVGSASVFHVKGQKAKFKHKILRAGSIELERSVAAVSKNDE
ncbi:MAG: metallophosphoesterase [Deltaproteobacteria bacterium]|nr:metallophosphoesterase [Deltaproteobacteria bacterium]